MWSAWHCHTTQCQLAYRNMICLLLLIPKVPKAWKGSFLFYLWNLKDFASHVYDSLFHVIKLLLFNRMECSGIRLVIFLLWLLSISHFLFVTGECFSDLLNCVHFLCPHHSLNTLLKKKKYIPTALILHHFITHYSALTSTRGKSRPHKSSRDIWKAAFICLRRHYTFLILITPSPWCFPR